MVHHWTPYQIDGVPLESVSKLWCTIGIPIKVMVYNLNPYQMYGVPPEPLSNLWCTARILMTFMV